MPYIDDIVVKGPKDNYNNALIESGIRRFIREYIININKVLYNLELLGVIASRFKSD
jgi:hypothetical protein